MDIMCAHCGEAITQDSDSGEWLHVANDSPTCCDFERRAAPEPITHLLHPEHEEQPMHDLDTTLIIHPSEAPAFVAAHRVAFHDLPAPDELHVGEHVWIVDHYYPGRVKHVGAHGHAIVEIPQWDYDAQAPMVRDGKLVTSELHYHPRHYPQLRVDVASAAFWPVPNGSIRIEA